MERRGVTDFESGYRVSRYKATNPVRYRLFGDLAWTETQTINISCSGVLFEVEELLEPETLVELSFDVPVESGGAGNGQLMCRGQVVRTIMPPAADSPPAVSPAIAELRVESWQ